jgi:hypothetical protein
MMIIIGGGAAAAICRTQCLNSSYGVSIFNSKTVIISDRFDNDEISKKSIP